MEKAGIDTCLGLPSGHAVTIIKTEDNKTLLIDSVNGQISEASLDKDFPQDGEFGKGYVMDNLYGRAMYPYSLFCTIKLEDSIASSLKNFYYLVNARESAFAQGAVEYLQISPDVDFKSAEHLFIPGLAEEMDSDEWEQERKEVKSRRDYLKAELVENVDQIS
jgi:hypothetical protein